MQFAAGIDRQAEPESEDLSIVAHALDGISLALAGRAVAIAIAAHHVEALQGKTNRIDFSAIFDPRTENLIITSAEDNLMKGAAGQAIQIMNIWSGFEETAGLI